MTKSELVHLGRNRGLLKIGNPGNRGGIGRPPALVRERLRGSFEQRVTILEEIADDPTVAPSDRIRAIDLMGKYGIGQIRELGVDEVRDKLQTTVAIIRETLAPAIAEPLLSRLRSVWNAP